MVCKAPSFLLFFGVKLRKCEMYLMKNELPFRKNYDKIV